MTLQISRPAIGPEEEALVLEALRSGWVGQGPRVAEFEEALASLLGVEHAIAVSSGTAALHLALLAVGVGPGDAVLVPDFTFPASANAVRHCGAEPILLDIDPATLNLSLDALADYLDHAAEQKDGAMIDRRSGRPVKAIMPVHLFGLPLPMVALLARARACGLAVVEDAACALGARDGAAQCGTQGDAGCFSFHPRKVITTGEGGLVVTRRPEIAEAIRNLRNHGMRSVGGQIEFSAAGYNFRMSDINAAVGLAQLRKLPMICERHAEVARWYDEALAGVRGVRRPARADGRIYQAYVVVLDTPGVRDAVIDALRTAGIESVRGTYAVSAQPAYAGIAACPHAQYAQENSIALPMHTGVDRAAAGMVARALARAIDEVTVRA